MSDLTRIHNPQSYPVIYDQPGHQVDGHASVMADLDDPVTARLIDRKILLVPAEPKPRFPVPGKPKKTTTTTVKEDATNE